MKKSATILLASAILFAPSVAFAHPGQGAGVSAGFLHPFTGVDHFLALVFLGAFASQLAPRRSLALGSGFLLAFVLAFAAARSGFSLPAQEAVLAASLLGMGMLVMVGRRLPFAVSLSVTALFAAYHGSAHGVELGAFALTSSLAGFFLAGLMLTGGTYAVGRLFSRGKEHPSTACLASCTS
ncbi:MAG: HupE/UreJ family protein [Alphaproteobacteria bacterium]|nr:HupE/UreJ family protein [Alphaproteobacteria bacterium]